MQSLNTLRTLAFVDSTINEFDAPNLTSITVDIIDYCRENASFIVGKKTS